LESVVVVVGAVVDGVDVEGAETDEEEEEDRLALFMLKCATALKAETI
jgi:hypothetical protein